MSVDMKMKKESKIPKKYVYGVLGCVLAIVICYTGYQVYTHYLMSEEDAMEEVLSDSGYAYLSTSVDDNLSDDLKLFIEENRDTEGAYLYREDDKVYVLISGGDTSDGEGNSITVEAPTYDDDLTSAKIVYYLHTYAADIEGDSDIVLLELEHNVETVSLVESTADIIID